MKTNQFISKIVFELYKITYTSKKQWKVQKKKKSAEFIFENYKKV